MTSLVLNFRPKSIHFSGRKHADKAIDDGTGYYPPYYDHQCFKDYVELSKKQIQQAKGQFFIAPDQVKKLNQVPKGEGQILITNHHDALDQAILATTMAQHNREGRYIASVHNFYTTKTGPAAEKFNKIAALLQAAGAFSYDKGKSGKEDKTNQEALKILKEGKHTLSFFPEGVHSHSFHEVLPMYKGVASMSLAAAQHLEKPVWVTPVAFVEQMKSDSLPTIQQELTILEQLLTECEGNAQKITPELLKKTQLQVANMKSHKPTGEELKAQTERIMGIYLKEYQARFPELSHLSLKDPQKTLATTSLHILQRLEQQHGFTHNQSIPHLYFAFNETYEKVKNKALHHLDNPCLKRDLIDARMAKSFYFLSQAEALKKYNTLSDKPEGLFQQLMFLRYIGLHGMVNEVVFAPRIITVEVGNPFNVSTWKASSPKASQRQKEAELTNVLQKQLQATLTNGRKLFELKRSNL